MKPTARSPSAMKPIHTRGRRVRDHGAGGNHHLEEATRVREAAVAV